MSRRSRVLFITAAFPGRVDPGRAIFVAHLARELSSTMDLQVLAPRIHRRDPARERWEGIDVRRFPFLSEGKLLKEYGSFPGLAASTYLISGFREAVSLAARQRPDVVLCHWVLPTGPIGLAASRVAGAPLVLNAHGSDVNVYAGKGFLFHRLAAEALRAAKFTIAASGPIRDRVVDDFGVSPDRVEVIPSGIDPAFLRGPSREESREAIGVPPEARLILYVGDLTGAKGIPVAARAIRQLQAGDDSIWACFVGRGPEARCLPRSRRFLLPGPLPNRTLIHYYRGADLFVFPSLTEGTPVSVMEALASGLPVVASRVGGVPGLVSDGKTGILVPPGDDGLLAGALRSLLGDPERRSRMARAAAERGGEYAAGPRADRVRAILERVIRGGKPEPRAIYDRFWQSTRADRRDARSRERALAACRLLGLPWNGAGPAPEANGPLPGAGGTLLDFGCGRGVAASCMKDLGFDVRGLDVSPEAVRETRRRGVSAEVGDIEKDPIRGRFDVILCLEVLEHLEDPRAALRRIAGALRPGGRVVVSLPESPPLIRLALRDGEGHLHRFSRGRALRLFRSAGLHVVREETLSVAPPRWGVLKAILDAAATAAPSALAICRVYALTPAAGDAES